ncbi:MAG TPA: restriction endonuclease subunit S [Bradyrhizobium sp.]
MTSWNEVRLHAISTVTQGGKLGLSGNDFVEEGYPAFGAGGMNGQVSQFEYEQAAIILSSIGARCGKCFYVSGRWTSLANTQVIIPDASKADTRFLWYQLDNESSWHRSGTAQPFIKPMDVKNRIVRITSLAEQRRIAAILDRADTLRAQRRATIEQLNSLRASVFVELFGDTSHWTLAPVAEIAAPESGAIRTGPFGSQLLTSEFTNDGIAVLGIDNAVSNEFKWSERRFVSNEKYQQLKRYTVLPGDVLITIMGTCGRCAIVPDDIPPAINTKHLCCITLDRSKMLPEFLHAYFLRHQNAQRYLKSKAKGAIMTGLNMGIIKEMPVPLVPMELQESFARRISMIDGVKATHRAALSELDALFASLQHRAFRGEL